MEPPIEMQLEFDRAILFTPGSGLDVNMWFSYAPHSLMTDIFTMKMTIPNEVRQYIADD